MDAPKTGVQKRERREEQTRLTFVEPSTPLWVDAHLSSLVLSTQKREVPRQQEPHPGDLPTYLHITYYIYIYIYIYTDEQAV